MCICQVLSAFEVESRTEQGLIRGHAYSIIGLAEVKKNVRLLETLFCCLTLETFMFTSLANGLGWCFLVRRGCKRHQDSSDSLAQSLGYRAVEGTMECKVRS